MKIFMTILTFPVMLGLAAVGAYVLRHSREIVESIIEHHRQVWGNLYSSQFDYALGRICAVVVGFAFVVVGLGVFLVNILVIFMRPGHSLWAG